VPPKLPPCHPRTPILARFPAQRVRRRPCPAFQASNGVTAGRPHRQNLTHRLSPKGGSFPGRSWPGVIASWRCSARGGMGEVYRADDLRLEQAVAMKFLSEALARWCRAGPLPSRGAIRAAGLAPQCLSRLRHRRSRGLAFSHDGICRWRGSRVFAAAHPAPSPGQGSRHLAAVVRGLVGSARGLSILSEALCPDTASHLA